MKRKEYLKILKCAINYFESNFKIMNDLKGTYLLQYSKP